MRQKTFAAALSAAVVALAVTPLAAQPSPVDPWSGLYIGIGGNAGGVIGGEKLDFQDLSATQDLSFGTNMDDTRLIGGVQLGQLWRVGGMALGLEDDVSFAKNIKYLETLRAVVGVPTGPFLIYGTGGLRLRTWTKNSPSIHLTNPASSAAASANMVGRQVAASRPL